MIYRNGRSQKINKCSHCSDLNLCSDLKSSDCWNQNIFCLNLRNLWTKFYSVSNLKFLVNSATKRCLTNLHSIELSSGEPLNVCSNIWTVDTRLSDVVDLLDFKFKTKKQYFVQADQEKRQWFQVQNHAKKGVKKSNWESKPVPETF